VQTEIVQMFPLKMTLKLCDKIRNTMPVTRQLMARLIYDAYITFQTHYRSLF